jgi:hypothetical protein
MKICKGRESRVDFEVARLVATVNALEYEREWLLNDSEQ